LSNSFTAASNLSSLRPVIVTLAPSSTSRFAIPRPIPPLPPVTIAVLPVNSMKFSFIHSLLLRILLLRRLASSYGQTSYLDDEDLVLNHIRGQSFHLLNAYCLLYSYENHLLHSLRLVRGDFLLRQYL